MVLIYTLLIKHKKIEKDIKINIICKQYKE